MNLINSLNLQQTHAARTLQLLVISLVALDFSWRGFVLQHDFSLMFMAIISLGFVVVIAVPVGSVVSRHAAIMLLTVHYLLAALILIFATNIFGPYFQLLILLILASVIWLNVRGALYGVLLSTLIVSLALLWQSGDIEAQILSQATLYLLGLALFGFLFEVATAKQRAENAELYNLSHDAALEHTRLVSLVNSLADAVIAIDKDGKVSMYNAASLDLLNTNKDLKGVNIQEFLHINDESGSAVDIIAEASQSRGPLVRDDIHVADNDKSRMDLYMSVSQVYSKGTQQYADGFIILLRDITKQKTLEEQRDEFISVASHELRTPIAIAEANISTALMPKFSKQLSKEGRSLLNQAHENVVFLSTLINDLHVLAQAEQDRLELGREEIEPKTFLDNFADNYKKQIEEKGIDFELYVENNIPTVSTSPDGLREILQNFITNSIKYTESGKIKLFAKAKENIVVFGVEDTGIGISRSDQKHIFEKFYRSEDYRTRQSGGTGLGLYIIKRLAERMGGDIWFESQLNKGSTFYCSVPLDSTSKGNF